MKHAQIKRYTSKCKYNCHCNLRDRVWSTVAILLKTCGKNRVDTNIASFIQMAIWMLFETQTYNNRQTKFDRHFSSKLYMNLYLSPDMYFFKYLLDSASEHIT